MYEEFYGFNKKPFDLIPNPEFLYLSQTHRKAINFLQYGLSSRAGFVLLTGEIGSGKTTIIRNLLDNLEAKAVPARIFNTKAGAVQLLNMICADFGISLKSKDKTVILNHLNEFLVEKFANDEKPVLIIDEAQNLKRECLEEVRLLSNLESNDTKLLQIILVGQPELKEVISQPGLQQLRQRISVDCHLGVLSEKETEEYFFHRLECAGNVNALGFPDGTFEMIHKACGGTPRLINILGDYLLLASFSEGTKEPSLDMIEEVIEDLSQNIAFYDLNQKFYSLSQKQNTKKNSTKDMQINSLDLILANKDLLELRNYPGQNLKLKIENYENVLKKIVYKQIEQNIAIRDYLENIENSLRSVDKKLKILSQSYFSKNVSKLSEEEKEARIGELMVEISEIVNNKSETSPEVSMHEIELEILMSYRRKKQELD
jgi:general secretion pathway protein A